MKTSKIRYEILLSLGSTIRVDSYESREGGIYYENGTMTGYIANGLYKNIKEVEETL